MTTTPTVADLRKQAKELDLDVASDARKDELEDAIANADSDLAVGKPLLIAGTSHPGVHEFAKLLDKAGYPNTTNEGHNPFGIVDAELLACTNQFRQDNDVVDVGLDPTLNPKQTIAVNTWAALIRATT